MSVDESRALSFGSVARDYDRLRPEPAPAAVQWLVPDGCLVALDLAAGTGLLSRALQRAVVHVIAVEPDPRMREVLLERSPGVVALPGRGEAIPIDDALVDAVLVSSAWHWMDPARALPEIARVLRDGARFGAIWTSRDREVDWVRRLDQERAALRDHLVSGEHRERPRSHLRSVQLPDELTFADPETASFGYTRRMHLVDVVAMYGTYSGLITADAERRRTVLEGARRLIEAEFPGEREIDVPMRSHCWRARRVPRQA